MEEVKLGCKPDAVKVELGRARPWILGSVLSIQKLTFDLGQNNEQTDEIPWPG